MSAKERGLQPTLGSDLEKVDAHVITPHRTKAAKPLHPGRVASQQEVTLSIDRDVLERFRATGNDWPKRVNEALRRAAKHL
jgi:uncharacterized protein (DUF4415 family)